MERISPSRLSPMPDNPRVSVVVAAYNHAPFLAQRLRSVLDQRYSDAEVIFLDDASTDNTPEAFAPFADDPRIRAVFNDTNTGNAYTQANRGVRMARGDYVWVAQGDDYADPDLLSTLVPILDANPRVGIAYCQSLAVDPEGNTIESLARATERLDPQRWQADFINDGRDEIRRFLIQRNTIPTLSAVVFRKSVLEAVGYFDESLRLSGDYLTWVRMLMRSDLAFVARPMNFFRYHGGSVRRRSSNEGLLIQGRYRVLEAIRDEMGLPDAELEAAFDRVSKSWLKKMTRRENRISLRGGMEIWRLARRVDPRLHRRLLAKLLPH